MTEPKFADAVIRDKQPAKVDIPGDEDPNSGQEPDAAEIKAFVKSNKLIVNYSIRRSRVDFIL